MNSKEALINSVFKGEKPFSDEFGGKPVQDSEIRIMQAVFT